MLTKNLLRRIWIVTVANDAFPAKYVANVSANQAILVLIESFTLAKSPLHANSTDARSVSHNSVTSKYANSLTFHFYFPIHHFTHRINSNISQLSLTTTTFTSKRLKISCWNLRAAKSTWRPTKNSGPTSSLSTKTVIRVSKDEAKIETSVPEVDYPRAAMQVLVQMLVVISRLICGVVMDLWVWMQPHLSVAM